MIFVADEAAEQSSEPVDHEGITNIKVSIDGTWLTRRGHSSLHGIATVCSTADPTKVLDFECLSRYCSTCSGLLGIKEHSPETYERLLAEHLKNGCQQNHLGSSAGMEAAGKKKSIEKRRIDRWEIFQALSKCFVDQKQNICYDTLHSSLMVMLTMNVHFLMLNHMEIYLFNVFNVLIISPNGKIDIFMIITSN